MEETTVDETSQLSRAARKKVRRLQRESQQQEKENVTYAEQRKKKVVQWSIVTVIGVALLGFFVFIFSGAKIVPYSGGEVHWHARIKVFVCGNEAPLPSPPSNVHLGTSLLHTHDDKLIHIEGTVFKPEDITLGKYMKTIGLQFKDNELLDKRNSDLCDNKPGEVKLLVNGIENAALAEYVIKDGEEYELRFA